MLTLIAAAAERNELGKDNDLVWHLPLDFKRFKKLTSGHCIIMGRKTFESLPGILPKRKHIVITRQTNYKAEGVVVVSSLEDAIEGFKMIIGLIYFVKPTVRNQYLGNGNAIFCLIVFQDSGQNSGKCQGTSIERMGQLTFSLFIFITKL